jgi:hypothetical protein
MNRVGFGTNPKSALRSVAGGCSVTTGSAAKSLHSRFTVPLPGNLVHVVVSQQSRPIFQ